VRTWGASLAMIALVAIAVAAPRMAMSGTPTAAVTPTVLNFPDTAQGSTSSPQYVTVTNSGSGNITLGTPFYSLSGPDFAIDPDPTHTTCSDGLSIASGSPGCQIGVIFQPTGATGFSETLTVLSNHGNPQVTLNGTGTAAPVAHVEPTSLDFLFQRVGEASAPQTVTVTNTGSADLVIDQQTLTAGVTITGTDASDYSISNNDCSNPGSTTTIAPTGSCHFDVTFTPATAGAKNDAKVQISDNASDSPQEVALTGTGAIPAVTIAPPDDPFDFGDVHVGVATPPTQEFTITNDSDVPLKITSIGITGTGFSITLNDCPTYPTETLDAHDSCAITVEFSPDSPGAKSGQVTLDDDADPTQQFINLSGNGVSPNILFDPAAGLDFGNVQLGDSADLYLQVTNDGNATLTFDQINVVGTDAADFALVTPDTGECADLGSIAESASCMIHVSFTPSLVDARNAQIQIIDSTFNNPDQLEWNADLKGFGFDPDVTLDPTELLFGDQTQGVPSAAKHVTLTNSGTGTLTIDSVAIDPVGPVFTQTNNCGSEVAQGASCTIDVVFTPDALGLLEANLVITDNASSVTQTVPLSGNGVAPAPAVDLDPTSINFGSQTIGTTSAPQAITLSNTGTGPLTITGITATGEFAQAHNCPISPDTLAAGNSCTINANFSPSSEGAKAGTVEVTDDATGNPHIVALSGTGTAVPVTVNLSMTKNAEPNPTECKKDVTYTIVASSTGTAQAENVVVTDKLPDGLTLVSVSATQGTCEEVDTVTGTCNLGTLPVGESATITVVTTPTKAGTIINATSATADSLETPVTTSVDLIVNNVNCGGGGGGGGCSMMELGVSGSAIPLGMLVSLAALAFARRRRG
jgi:uncharacterized repeat protein (TIGR01451 family)